jgi:hypothetical protein
LNKSSNKLIQFDFYAQMNFIWRYSIIAKWGRGGGGRGGRRRRREVGI